MQNKHLIGWLRFAAFFLFIGRAWQHILYNGPYSTIYYSNSMLGGFFRYFTGETEFEYLSNPNLAVIYDKLNLFLGVLFIGAAVGVLFVNKRKSFFKLIVKIGGYLLLLVAFGYFVEKKFAWGQFFEYSSQIAIPWLLLMAVKFKMKKRFLSVAKLSLAITFICHGLYAIGYYPIPGSFMNMMINVFGMSNEQAILWLKVAGYADFIFAIGIFIPKVGKYFLYYGFLWGFATALARIVANVDGDFLNESLNQYTFEFLVRMPHFILPLILLKYRKEIII